jgi:signal transduction histidine kinase
LGRGQAEAADPDDALDRLVAAIATELRFPAVVLEDADGTLLSATGRLDVADFYEVSLEHLGHRVGVLKIAARSGTDGVTDAERQLTSSMADAAAAVVAYRRAAAELETANEEIVASRDAERRRYQRDLHDGLGPRLTAVAFKLDALANHLRAGRPEIAASLLDDARSELTSGVDEIRSYIHALVNPTVATSGLRRALADRIERVSADTDIDTTLDIGPLGPLDDAVQSAVLAVVSEAFTNVVRHAGARRCTIELNRRDNQLDVSVCDDGRGISDGDIPGVGLRSMRERVEELGGTFRISDQSPGTSVFCKIPVST